MRDDIFQIVLTFVNLTRSSQARCNITHGLNMIHGAQLVDEGPGWGMGMACLTIWAITSCPPSEREVTLDAS